MKSATALTGLLSASKILNKIAHEHNVKSLLFYVKGGGCSGFNYKIEPFRGTPYRFDEIIICSKSLLHVVGTTIDWKKDIMGEAFNFINPNAASQCGCGTSFSI